LPWIDSSYPPAELNHDTPSFWLSDEGLFILARLHQSNDTPRPRVLSAEQYETLDALVDVLIPPHGPRPGARQARVADYIDLLLAESDDSTKLEWLTGLAELDRESKTGFGVPFAKLNPAWMRALVHEIHHRRTPLTALESFVALAHRTTVHGFYSVELTLQAEARSEM
jgi:hypothetical protein